jgi:hypothetical protein
MAFTVIDAPGESPKPFVASSMTIWESSRNTIPRSASFTDLTRLSTSGFDVWCVTRFGALFGRGRKKCSFT